MAKDKVVLAYSGGLDTSVIVKWLQVERGMDVIAICGNVGQDERDLGPIKQKALDMGAIVSEAVDMREEYAEKILSKAIWANGKYEGIYPLLSALSRPLISKHLVDIAHEYGAQYVVSSPRNGELMRLFHSFCAEKGMMHDNDEIFRYLAAFEEKGSPEQLSLF